MSHEAQRQFIGQVKQRFPSSFIGGKVLEVGSYNVNGSVREFFWGPLKYIGLDLAPGKDVDVVCNGAEYKTEERFDVVISTECFEHDRRWVETFNNMMQLVKRGGLIIFTCASHNRHEHGTPRTSPFDSALATEYYRNLNVFDFEREWHLNTLFSWYCFEARENDLYMWGVRA